MRLPGGERARLTALYGGLLVLAGAMLIGLINFLVAQGLYTTITTAVARRPADIPSEPAPSPNASAALGHPGPTPVQRDQEAAEAIRAFTQAAEQATQNQLLTISLITLAVFAIISVALAWWMAGRVLRPVGVITRTAQRLSGENLHERIALDAPAGELKQLADTFDDMLDRMEHLVGAQKRFAANAAHELRTPLAVQRAAAEIGLDTTDSAAVARIRRKLIQVADDSERLIEGLLLLSVTDEGLERREPVDLAALARTVATECGASKDARARGITVRACTVPLGVDGDPVLLAHLVRNLVSNAVRYNHEGGHVQVDVHDRALTVTNTGPLVPPDTVPYLFEPFRRLRERLSGPGEGVGLGLSIVASIARAHGAQAHAEANPDGGLTVRVTFGKQPAGSARGAVRSPG
ncbi:HAMP domain-containing sensor histidine kinase [Streptomyces olivoreticuli]|uniref:sensor histidine kinase n=1 Tax=Streptomyces olivoreticuli TaxID=68246 RepID=UPI0026592CF1|nr:HAMP domain-containing sensor histidine kinase [Streptomyces olivoreticuli]WKK24095.1 HAMP domain-containing sensor histidine kinase [Streptomyces olivoreticuli]